MFRACSAGEFLAGANAGFRRPGEAGPAVDLKTLDSFATGQTGGEAEGRIGLVFTRPPWAFFAHGGTAIFRACSAGEFLAGANAVFRRPGEAGPAVDLRPLRLGAGSDERQHLELWLCGCPHPFTTRRTPARALSTSADDGRQPPRTCFYQAECSLFTLYCKESRLGVSRRVGKEAHRPAGHFPIRRDSDLDPWAVLVRGVARRDTPSVRSSDPPDPRGRVVLDPRRRAGGLVSAPPTGSPPNPRRRRRRRRS